MTERHTCPRRLEHMLAGLRSRPDSDTWETNRWDGPGRSFPWSWSPRTCSFCGCVHPDDLFRLLEEGWEDELTTKRYKGYLQPPGYHQALNVGLRKMRKEGLEGFNRRPSVSPPNPPAKFYTHHLSAEQIAKLNERRKKA